MDTISAARPVGGLRGLVNFVISSWPWRSFFSPLNRVAKAPYDPQMTAAQFVVAAFHHAAAQHPALHRKWTRISARLGGTLPATRLMSTVQMLGELDMVIRSMEDDFRPGASGDSEAVFAFHYQMMLSEQWIGAAYEVFRLLDERQLAPERDAISAIHHDLRMIRIPLEKYEIAAENKLGGPTRMQRHPPNNDASDDYIYLPGDPARSHIMPTGISARGSVTWQVIDAKAQRSYWLERRELSERIVSSFGAGPAAADATPS
jgi:hypothetical protein